MPTLAAAAATPLAKTTPSTQVPPHPTLAPSPETLERALYLRDAETQSPAVDGYSYLGCVAHGTKDSSDQVLINSPRALGKLDPPFCCELCRNLRVSSTWSFCGVYYGSNCVCGHKTEFEPSPLPASRCSSTCAGSSEFACGGWSAMNLYSATSTYTSTTSVTTGVTSIQDVSGYSHLGCFEDPSSKRVLDTDNGGNYHLTEPEFCGRYCLGKDSSFIYFGVEYGYFCYCDSTTQSAATADATSYGYGCWGNAEVQCGGPNHMNLYQATDLALLGATSSTAATTGSSLSDTVPTSQTSSSDSGSRGGSGVSGGAIAGIVIGVLAGLSVAGLLFWFLWVRRPRKSPAMIPGSAKPPTELTGSSPESHEAPLPDVAYSFKSNGPASQPHELDAHHVSQR